MSQLKVNTIRHTGASSDAVTLATDGTCTAKITNNLSNRNLVVNGACNVAQRGTSSTASEYASVDRFKVSKSAVDESPTQAQADVASGTTPYSLGFRKAFKVTNGDQTSGAEVNDVLIFSYNIEAQDIANSGWNYTSSSSYITLSCWVKSSVAQNFYIRALSMDGTQQSYVMETGSLSANTWTKVTKTIPGNSNLTFDNDVNNGLRIEFVLYRGTNFTGSVTLNQWATKDDANRNPDCASDWYVQDEATFELTGLQLEVGDVATDFEHRSYNDELLRCKRYYQQLKGVALAFNDALSGCFNSATAIVALRFLEVEMRAGPDVVLSSTLSDFDIEPFDQAPSAMSVRHTTTKQIAVNATSPTSRTEGFFAYLSLHTTGALITITAEL